MSLPYMNVLKIDDQHREKWDDYVWNHTNGTLYHLYGWRDVVRKAYGKKTYYLSSFNKNAKISGVLPLIHINNFIFGNRLISIPYFDYAGLLADDRRSATSLIIEAQKLAKQLDVDSIELRQRTPLETGWSCERSIGANVIEGMPKMNTAESSKSKVSMILNLPATPEDLFQSFKSKLRSQIRRPAKSGLKATIGGIELLNDFYKVFSINMRDLGSPVHSKNLMRSVIETFPGARFVMVYADKIPMACSLIVGFKGTLSNPWASSLKKYSAMAPNMLLYWTMLQFACENRYKTFDFGRSSLDENTFRFKRQWGAKPTPLFWYSLLLNGEVKSADLQTKSFSPVVKIWRKIPVTLTKFLGPAVRKNIGL